MIVLLVLAAVFASGAFATVLRRRNGKTDTLGTFHSEDTTSPEAHAGFTSHTPFTGS